MSQMKFRRTASAVITVLISAACAPSFDGKLPCADDHSCPTNFHCAAGKCVSGDSAPRIVWSAPDGATPLAGQQTFSVMVDHPDGVSSVKLAAGAKDLGTFAAPSANFCARAAAKVDFAVDTTTLAD